MSPDNILPRFLIEIIDFTAPYAERNFVFVVQSFNTIQLPYMSRNK